MSAVFLVTSAASSTALTSVTRARSFLNLSSTLYTDAFVSQLIESASAAIANYLNIVGDGVTPPTLGRERLTETFRNVRTREAVILARSPLVDVISVEDDSGVSYRLQTGADGAVDVGVDATAFTSAAGPNGAVFNAGHVGKQITIAGAGAAGGDHVTTIAALVSDSAVTLTDAAVTTVVAGAYTIEDIAFGYEWRAGASLLYKLSGGYRSAWCSSLVRVVYDAGWTLPATDGSTNGTLPLDIQDACILFLRRQIDKFRESDSDNQRLKSESIPGVGSWTFALEDINWDGGVPSDVRAMLDRYRRRFV